MASEDVGGASGEDKIKSRTETKTGSEVNKYSRRASSDEAKVIGGRLNVVSVTPRPRLEEEQEVHAFLGEDKRGIPIVEEETEGRNLHL